MKIVLASASPRRRELLARLIREFEVDPAQVDEDIPGTDAVRLSEELAVRKAKEVFRRHPGALVIGADTVVAINEDVLGKPADPEDAAGMLARLSGRTHRVITGVAICSGEAVFSFHEITHVTFRALTQDEIQQYVSTGEPMDKAGAYGIQGIGALLIEKIDGDYLNVVGFPLAAFRTKMREAGWGNLMLF